MLGKSTPKRKQTMKVKWNSCTFMRALSEFSATSLFMIICCMGSTANGRLVVSLNQGLAIVIVMHIFGFISGAHANPCVSIACCGMGYISSRMMLLYVGCQLLGAACGYFVLLQLLPQSLIEASKVGIGLLEPMKGLSSVQILSIEGFLTTVLILAWCALWDVRSGRFLDSVTLRMGCIVAACNLVGGQLTGATMNPARLLIPAIYHGQPTTVLLQLAGQLLAAVIMPQFWQLAYTLRYRPLLPESHERPAPELYLTP